MSVSLRARALAAFALAALLAGCGSMNLNPMEWFGRKDPPKPAALVDIAQPRPFPPLWQARVGSSDGYALTPAVVGGSVYAAAFDGTLVRLDEASGKELWRVKAGSQFSGGVGSDGKIAVVGTTEGEVIAVDAEGRILWRARVSSEVLASPVVAGDTVIVRSADSKLFALDARDGKRRWVYQRAAPTLVVRSAAGVVVRANFVFAGFPGGKLVAVALNNGGLRWEGTVASPRGATEVERVADVIGQPWLGDRESCAVAFQGRVACFDLSSGNPAWAKDMSSSSGLSVGRYVYVSEDRGAVAALERTNGNLVWTQDRLTNRRLSAPLPLGAQVAVGDLQGYVHFLSRDKGEFIARVATDGSPILAAPLPLANGLLVQTGNGGLYAFKVE